jgi:hypothetical protein
VYGTFRNRNIGIGVSLEVESYPEASVWSFLTQWSDGFLRLRCCTFRQQHLANFMEQSPSWEAINCLANQDRPCLLLNPKVHRRIDKSQPLQPYESNPYRHTRPFKIHLYSHSRKSNRVLQYGLCNLLLDGATLALTLNSFVGLRPEYLCDHAREVIIKWYRRHRLW